MVGFPGGSDSKESTCNAEDLGLIPGSGRSPGGEHGTPLQSSFLENPMDRGAWQTAVHRVAKSQTLFVQRLLDVTHGGQIIELAGTYQSIDTEGNPITLSGKVMLPANGNFKRFILVSHYTVGSNAEAPSNCFSLEGVLVPLGYCIIVPDYLG